MSVLTWTMIGFWLGAVPFSLWLGSLLLGTDIRAYGDGNPGATNAWKAGGWRLGLPALLLDYAKGAIPVSLAHFGVGLSGWGLVFVALAPAIGHAFSPFLRFTGGKALAATFGLWTGLTLAEGPIILGTLLAIFVLIQGNDGWAVILGMFCFLGYLVLRQADLYLLAVWFGNLIILALRYRSVLRLGLRPRPWLAQFLRQVNG